MQSRAKAQHRARSRFHPRHGVLICVALVLALTPLGRVLLPAGEGDLRAAGLPQARAAELNPSTPASELPLVVATPFATLESELSVSRVAVRERVAKRGKVLVSSPKGTREWSASSMSDHGLPSAADRAYRTAARTMAGLDPSCQLPWTLLAGIGRVESDHGRYGGSTLGQDGVSHPLIIGVPLNGIGPVAAIHDSDNGKLDKDRVWDRAVGPMQFIPTTWAGAGRDGDSDGVKSPNDIDDAALAAAGYLCSGSGSVLSEAGMAAAVLSYNHDDYYVALVMSFERGYRTGSFVMPSPPAPEESATTDRAKRKAKSKRTDAEKSSKPSATASPRPRPRPSSGPTATSSPKPSPKPTTKPTPKPPKPTPKPPKPTPKPPKPTPTGPTLVSVSGTFSACGGWCVGGFSLDLGPSGQRAARAAADFDGDGSTETNAAEFTGLSGSSVTLLAEKSGSVAVVYTIDGEDYRFGDGSFA